MNKEYLKDLYKKMSIFDDAPESIKQRINEYTKNEEVEKCKYIIHNYKTDRENLINSIYDMTSRIDLMNGIKRNLEEKDFDLYVRGLFYYDPKIIIKLKDSLCTLEGNYRKAKSSLRYYYNSSKYLKE